jgi:hypothetical protein
MAPLQRAFARQIMLRRVNVASAFSMAFHDIIKNSSTFSIEITAVSAVG